MFVVRDGRFLVLTRAVGRGQGLEYLPGGIVGPGEDPLDAAVREAEEESGLDVSDVELLRVWTYPVPADDGEPGYHTVHATFVGRSDDGEVVLSREHSAHRWVTPEEYVERWCTGRAETEQPGQAAFFREVRRNCELLAARLDRA
jgi:8-oxo-dGTP pyrophosphatase MutT (NUDIX family)